MNRFVEDVRLLRQQVLRMGQLAEGMVAASVSALRMRDPAFIEQVRSSEPILDRLQVEVDREAVRLMTLYSPPARDLRLLLTIARINSELERIGDQAVDNCEYVERLMSATERPLVPDLSRMAAAALRMVHEALGAFEHEDLAIAHAVVRSDIEVDALDAAVFRTLLEQLEADAHGATSALSVLLLGRSFERIADHATNISEEVHYLVEGRDIRHQE